MHASTSDLLQHFPLAVELAARDVCPFRPDEDVRLTCRRGSLWVTFDNEPEDIVLEPGDSCVAPRGKGCVVYAFEASELRLQPQAQPYAAGYAWTAGPRRPTAAQPAGVR